MVSTAFVKIWGKNAGAIAWDEDRQLGSFEYLTSFVSDGWELSPLKMPLQSSKIYSFPELRPEEKSPYNTFKGLPGMLADVLPDKYGNQLINSWLAQQGRPSNAMNPVETLCFIGKRGIGALEFEPIHIKERKLTYNIEIDQLVEISQKMLNERNAFETNISADEEKAMLEILKIGTSAGGARPKAVIAFNKKTKEVRSGQANVPKGFEHYLIKLDGVSSAQFGATYGYGRVEMAYYLMAVACDIEMMPCQLLEENDRAHFMTKRFDRDEKNQKHHMQTWCGLKHFDFTDVLSFSYEQLFQTMRELRLDYPSAEQMFRRMVFNVLSRNCDDHTKNFSFILKQNADWQLAPAYDLCHAYRPDSIWVSQHALSINGKRKGIRKDDILNLATQMNIKKPELIISQINEVVSNWKNYAEEVKVNVDLRDAIAKTLIQY